MENMIRILKAVDHIEKNLKETISLNDLAAQACFSDYYFHKLFHLIVGDPPGDYIRKRRLSEAALILQDSKMKVLDAALEYGYSSHEAFTRAFHRQFGLSPKDVKNKKVKVIRYNKPALTLKNISHLQKGVSMEPKIEFRPEMKFVGPVYYGNNSLGEIPVFWREHFKEVSSLPSRKGKGCFGICFHLTDYVGKGFFHYMPAVEVEDYTEIPMGAVGKTIPGHKYAVFTHRGGSDSLDETYMFIHGTWFPHKKYRMNEDFDFEHYTTDEKGQEIIEIYIPVVEV